MTNNQGVMDRARPEYDAKGIPAGAFRLFPTLDIIAAYDDNVFRRPNGQSDYFFTIAPVVRLVSQWGQHFLEVYGGSTSYLYTRFAEENLTDWRLGADGRLDISRAMTVTLNGYFGEEHEPWSAPNNIVGFQAAPNRAYHGHVDATATYQPSRLGLSLNAQFDRTGWTNTPAIGGGTLDNSDRNQNQFQGYAKAFYNFSPNYDVFVQASVDQRQFDEFLDRSGLHRSSHGYRIDGGLDMQISHLVSGEVYFGYLKQFFSQHVAIPLSDVTGVDYGAELDWYLSPILTVHLSGKRTLSDVVVNGASVSDDLSAVLSADYEFRRNIIVQARAAYVESRFVGTRRSDSTPSAGLTVKYLMNNYASLDIRYDYTKRTTTNSGQQFSDNTIGIDIALQV